MDSMHSSTKKMEKLLEKIKKKSSTLFSELTKHQQIIIKDPLAGKILKGDLKEFRSYDFKIKENDIRICYIFNEADNHLIFVYFGTRQNFYQEVKRYL